MCTESKKHENVQRILSTNSKQRVASSAFGDQVTESGCSKVTLPAKGHPLSVTVADPRAKRQLDFTLSHEEAASMQARFNFSDNKTNHIVVV
jgi:hypothetical protein